MATLPNRRARPATPPSMRAILRAALIGAFACLVVAAHAQDPDYVVKAKMLVTFTQPQYANWPATAFPDASTPFLIGVLGDESVGGKLESIAAKQTVGGRRISVRHAKQPEELKGCHVVFIGKSESARASSILSTLAGTNALTVGDAENFTQQGGVIAFFLKGEKVRFHINGTAARRAGVDLTARFLGNGE